MTARKPQRGRPRKVSDGAINNAIQTSKNVSEETRKLGVSHGHIYLWWKRLGCPGVSPAKRIKQRKAREAEAIRLQKARDADVIKFWKAREAEAKPIRTPKAKAQRLMPYAGSYK